MRKMTAWILALAMALTAFAGMALAEENQEAEKKPVTHTIEKKEIPLYWDDTDLETTFPLYFLDGTDDLPYVSAEDWRDLLVFVHATAYQEEGYDLTTETGDDGTVTYTRENGYTMVVNFSEDSIGFPDYDIFMRTPGMSSLLDMTSVRCFDEAGQPVLLQKNAASSYDRIRDVVVIDLEGYGIQLVAQDGLYLMPLQTMSDLTLAPNAGINCFFNTRCLILTGTITAENELYYDAPAAQRSEALADYGYSELCLMMDMLYGLKDTHDIDNFSQMFYEIGFDEALSGRDPADADKAVWQLINSYLDDLHSEFCGFSYLTGRIDYTAPDGVSNARFTRQVEKYQAARSVHYPDGYMEYEEFGNTAYITFNTFTMSTLDGSAYYGYEDKMAIPYEDTFALVLKAHELINREESPVENVVLDLSLNTGGSVDAAAYVLAWFLGEASISIKDTYTGALSSTTYRADVNLDHMFDEKDTLAGKRLFCLISPVSFSCGNLTPSAFKESGDVTLLGRTSGGGSCIVQNISTAWGTSFRISAPRRMSFLKNGSFYDIDRGADPDFVIVDPVKFYDRQALTDYINSLF